MLSILNSLLGKLGYVKVTNTRVNSPSSNTYALIVINKNIHNEAELKKELIEQKPVIQEALEIKASDLARIVESTKVKTRSANANKPSKKELELVQLFRANRPYHSITDVKTSYDKNGTITMSWTES